MYTQTLKISRHREEVTMKKGIAASKGYAIGKVFIQEHEEIIITDAKVADVAAEKETLKKALEASKAQLEAIRVKTLNEIGEHEAEVFGAHLELLDDPGFAGEMENTIENESINAMKAVQMVTDTFVMIFESMEDAYMKERAADVKASLHRCCTTAVSVVAAALCPRHVFSKVNLDRHQSPKRPNGAQPL